MARQNRQAVREDDFLSESDLSPSSVDSAGEGGVHDASRQKTYRDEPVRRRSKSRKEDEATEESSLCDTDESDEEKLIGTAYSNINRGKKVKRWPSKTKKGKKTRRLWEMRSGDGAAAASAQSSSNTGLIVGVILFIVLIAAGAGVYWAYSQGYFGSSPSAASTGAGSLSDSSAATGGVAAPVDTATDLTSAAEATDDSSMVAGIGACPAVRHRRRSESSATDTASATGSAASASGGMSASAGAGLSGGVSGASATEPGSASGAFGGASASGAPKDHKTREGGETGRHTEEGAEETGDATGAVHERPETTDGAEKTRDKPHETDPAERRAYVPVVTPAPVTTYRL